jgi:hypothetical protein
LTSQVTDDSSSAAITSASSTASSSNSNTHTVTASPAGTLQQQPQHAACADDMLEELLGFCRVATVAVPLPEVCNNPGCRCCDGLSEAAAAVKACGACGTRYCSRQCQEADWRKHRAACKLRNASAAGR